MVRRGENMMVGRGEIMMVRRVKYDGQKGWNMMV